MNIKLRIMPVAAVLLLGVSAGVSADAWNCSHDDLVREVVIDYPQGGSLPCDVIYKKQTEGFEDKVLWYAESQEGYCEEKAREFVGKLESWGWVCLETVSAATEEDDTSANVEATIDDAGAESEPVTE